MGGPGQDPALLTTHGLTPDSLAWLTHLQSLVFASLSPQMPLVSQSCLGLPSASDVLLNSQGQPGPSTSRSRLRLPRTRGLMILHPEWPTPGPDGRDDDQGNPQGRELCREGPQGAVSRERTLSEELTPQGGESTSF